MNYAEILKDTLKYNTLENLFKEFLDTVYLYSSFDCISGEQFYEIVEVLNREESGFYSVDENNKITTIITNSNKYLYLNEKIKRIQNYTYEIEDCNDENFQILIISEDNTFKAWFLPIFFKEFYVFCEGINNTIKRRNEEISTNKEKICNILATKIAKNPNGVITILKEFENVDNNITINVLNALFNAYLSI